MRSNKCLTDHNQLLATEMTKTATHPAKNSCFFPSTKINSAVSQTSYM